MVKSDLVALFAGSRRYNEILSSTFKVSALGEVSKDGFEGLSHLDRNGISVTMWRWDNQGSAPLQSCLSANIWNDLCGRRANVSTSRLGIRS